MVTKTQHFDTTSEPGMIYRYKRSTDQQSGAKRVSDVPGIQRAVGNFAIQQLLRSGRIQAKLTLNQPGDQYEQESDKVAEQVMRMPTSQTVQNSRSSDHPLSLHVQRLSPQSEVHLQPEEALQAKEAADHPLSVAPEPQASIHSLKGGGQPLPESTRAFMEPRFGYDFSQVRINTDERAAETARAVNAQAYTVGQNIAFGMGQYQLGTSKGQLLLAHELTHVIQQKSSLNRAGSNGLQVDSPLDASQREAGAVTNNVLNIQQIHSPQFGTVGVIARQIAEGEDDVMAELAVEDKEGTTGSSNIIELNMPAGQGSSKPKSTKKVSSSSPGKGKKSNTYLVDVKLNLPSIGNPDRSLNTAQISNLVNDSSERTPGLTKIEFEYKAEIGYQQKGTKHWIKSIKVYLTNVIFKVFLTNQNKPGSCEDKDLLRHEMHHAADCKRNFAEGKKIILDSLEGWPDAASPLETTIISPEDLREEIKTLIDRRIWEIQYNNWLDTYTWDVVDYPRLYSACPGEHVPLQAPSPKEGYPGKPPEVFAPELPQ